jgi:hypothetical protein
MKNKINPKATESGRELNLTRFNFYQQGKELPRDANGSANLLYNYTSVTAYVNCTTIKCQLPCSVTSSLHFNYGVAPFDTCLSSTAFPAHSRLSCPCSSSALYWSPISPGPCPPACPPTVTKKPRGWCCWPVSHCLEPPMHCQKPPQSLDLVLPVTFG